MLEYFNYYEELRRRSVVSEEITRFWREDNDGILGDLVFDKVLPCGQVLVCAMTHEKKLFQILIERPFDINTPYFHQRFKYNELFECLCLLGDDCLQVLLSKLKCSDAEYNAIHHSVMNRNLSKFCEVMEHSTIDTTCITPICRWLYIFLFGKHYQKKIEEIGHHMDGIKDEEQHKREDYIAKKQVQSIVINFIEDIIEPDDAKFEESMLSVMDANNSECDEDVSEDTWTGSEILYQVITQLLTIINPEITKDGCDLPMIHDMLYKGLLLIYYVTKDKMLKDSIASNVIHDILFTANYEKIWRDYNNADAKELLDNEITNFLKLPNSILADLEPDNHTTDDTPSLSEIKSENYTINVSPSLASNTSEAEQLFSAVKKIVEALPDIMFDQKEGKKTVIELFDSLLLNKFDGDNNANQYNLIKDLNALRGGRHSKYEYNGLNLKAFVEVIGYLIRKKFICAKPADVANEIVSAVPTDVFKKCKGIPQDTLASYIGNGVNSKKEYKKRWALIDFVLKIK